ncbi:mannose-1-phosphate guanylyltransferase [Roseinatronobacter monicus]|uniref:Mannose-1-phosphate guanylyltransferase/mannose-6-phosphate isomerase n=1 Tax=Roseinatronobacter monicus TaxID=393481 RepID=A0A543K8T8_9RHOB|nr:sugar phosphate nucleotidyltransferase [Roseinatronobacter monicus]TQM91498.1 mannose-1-phosphate guanylyltransferase/mannose-6-phosphate isomerase [Roseinatronobacter monicus]
MTQITPVLLCGGSGTRLWPVSRKAMPKQFTRLLGQDTLYQAALTRLSGPGWEAPMVVTSEAYLGMACDQAVAAGVVPADILVEPSARNTAPAILAAALHLAATDPDALLLIAPSDHAIPDARAFRDAVMVGAGPARNGQIVTFGICPTRAETGYGWLEMTEVPDDFAPRPMSLAGFVEKPHAARAEQMLAAGRYLWNAGIFLASAQTLITAFETHARGLMLPVRCALADATHRHGIVRLASGPWARAEDISVDYAVMERADNLCVVPFSAGWSDLGDWNAIWREGSSDESGVIIDGDVTAIDCHDSLLRSEVSGLELVGVGLTDIVAVAMGDTVLIAHRDRAQDVKEAVARLKAREAAQAEGFVTDADQWSRTEAEGMQYASRCVQITQSTEKTVPASAPETRWTVLAGRAFVSFPNEVVALTKGTSVSRQQGVAAQIRNPDNAPLVLLEVQEHRLTQKVAEHPTPFAIAAE